jgi:predicted ferric reductase
MNPQVWWFLARAGGLVAYGLVSASVIWGLALSTRILDRPAPGWLLDLHRYLGALALTFTGAHLAGLVLDDYVRFTLVDLLVPFAASWRPAAVAAGVVALHLLLAVEATSLAKRRLPHRWWRRAHLVSFPLFVLASAHTLAAGSDTRHPAVLVLVGLSVAAVVFLTVVRLLLPRRSAPRRSGPRHDDPVSAREVRQDRCRAQPRPQAAASRGARA